MRLFVALDIDDPIRQSIARFMDGVRGFAPDVRWVRPESQHVTLKFIGERPVEAVEDIKRALSAVQGGSFEISFRGWGFFPTPKAARVFWVGIEAGPQLSTLARAADNATSTLGIPRETHEFSPHLTLARAGSGSPRRRKDDRASPRFEKLQGKLTLIGTPEFGTMTAREFFLYQSQLSPTGSRYTKIARFGLG